MKIHGRKLLRWWKIARLPEHRPTGASIVTALLILLCLAALAFSQQVWTPAAGVSYGKTTRLALDHLLSSAAKLKSGDTAGAGQVLQGMETSAAELGRAADFFREHANRENIRCVSNIGTLENDIAAMFEKEQEADRKVAALEAELQGITERKNYSAAQIQRVQADIQTALAAMQERERKLEELRKWWWVPFYNLYLGIRTLVDDDIGNYKSLKNTLQDKGNEMAKHQADWQAANVMLTALRNDQRSNRETHAGLIRMRADSEADLINLKKNAVFLTEAGIFWSRVTNLLKIKVVRPIDMATQIGVLNTMLTSNEIDAPLFYSLQTKPFTDLYNSLATFADTIDQGSNFLMGDNKSYCGGPPKTTAKVSSACQIDATRFYKIVDPVKCSFQYQNPPGCPPRPKEVNVSEQTVAAGNTRGTWTRAEGQNWVGRSRCDTEAIYYGTVNDENSCERKCKSDGNCMTWTFNSANGMISGTTGECWGGTKNLKPLKESWGGFESGGTNAPGFRGNP